MSGNSSLGGLEEMVLLAIQNLGRDGYGVAIHRQLKDVGRDISIGSLYITLGRLESKCYVKSVKGESTPERGGRAKLYYELTGQGKSVLADAEIARTKLRLFRSREGLA